MDQTFLELFVNAYTITSQIMFPVLTFILVLLILDLNKYGKTSSKINKILNNLSLSIQDSGFKKNIKVYGNTNYKNKNFLSWFFQCNS